MAKKKKVEVIKELKALGVTFDEGMNYKDLCAMLKEALDKDLTEKVREGLVGSLGDVVKRPKPKITEQDIIDAHASLPDRDTNIPVLDPFMKKCEQDFYRPKVCGCGCTSNISQCPKCGRTWCDGCLKGNVTCPICGSRGV